MNTRNIARQVFFFSTVKGAFNGAEKREDDILKTRADRAQGSSTWNLTENFKA